MEETKYLTDAVQKFAGSGAGWAELVIIVGFAWHLASKFLSKLGSIEKAITDLGERILKVEMTHNGRMNVQDAMIAEIKEDQKEIKVSLSSLKTEIDKQKGV